MSTLTTNYNFIKQASGENEGTWDINLNQTFDLIDTEIKNRENESVKKSGDTMSGFLTLHTNPTSNLHAATKQYIDNLINGITNLYSSANVVNTLVKRDASGNFSAGIVTANLQGNVTGNITGNAHTVDSFHASTTTGSGIIPVGDSNGRIAWGAKPAFRGCLVYNNATTSANVNVNWLTNLYDTDNIHSTETNTDRLKVPVGVTKVRISANLWISAHTNARVVIELNGAPFIGNAYLTNQPFSTNSPTINMSTAIIPVKDDDYFTIKSVNSAVAADSGGSFNWFAMEIKE